MRTITSAKMLTLALPLVAIALLAGIYLTSSPFGGNSTTLQSSTRSTTSPAIQGVVTGYVTVGPSKPVCSENQSCNEDMTGYSLLFTPNCHGSTAGCQPDKAVLSPSGHYSILLPAGNYTVTGLDPSCSWVGCPTAFPKTVVVEGGMQVVFNINIDTGIR